MLQNRVDPFGSIIETSARGAWMGNRGVIHNETKQITHAFKHKAWITCVLAFKDRRRTVMSPKRWTELFFLDEATAFAAGHRPCFECRREAANKFKTCWIEGNPSYNFRTSTSIRHIDDVIHGERIDRGARKVIHHRMSSEIAEGTFLLIDDAPYVFTGGMLRGWTPFGYGKVVEMPMNTSVAVLTPSSIVNAFRAGYLPQVGKLTEGLSDGPKRCESAQ